MLKIRDSVDLKELEKFGFSKKSNYYTKENCYNIEVISVIDGSKLIDDLGDTTRANTLYDLIQAGLVEKVE